MYACPRCLRPGPWPNCYSMAALWWQTGEKHENTTEQLSISINESSLMHGRASFEKKGHRHGETEEELLFGTRHQSDALQTDSKTPMGNESNDSIAINSMSTGTVTVPFCFTQHYSLIHSSFSNYYSSNSLCGPYNGQTRHAGIIMPVRRTYRLCLTCRHQCAPCI